MNMVDFRDVSKRFGKVEALKGVSFTIPDKSVTAFLGPNGAGKTTSMKLAMGFLKPDRGMVLVWGEEPWRNEGMRSRVGYLPEKPIYPMDIVVEDFLNHLARLRRISKSDVDRVVRLIGLEKMVDRKMGTLSRGYIQRIGIAQSLLGDPELLILDEPTANLDPATRREIIDLLKVLHKELGVSMIISSHIIPELQEIANYAVFIDRGLVLDHGYLSDLWKRYEIEAVFNIEAIDANAVAKALVEKLYIRSIKRVGERVLEVSIDPGYHKAFENLLTELSYLIKGYGFKTTSLGDLYEKVVRGRH
ncbi:MAG: ABC transporter ATP-binding protein [Thaumarchaeota archaeon]|jgi:ABC-type multidrug transport system ATPase subunit|nr:ABC transporter ATP-binding protein [Candidatus Geocrenenecus arthurdayi]